MGGKEGERERVREERREEEREKKKTDRDLLHTGMTPGRKF